MSRFAPRRHKSKTFIASRLTHLTTEKLTQGNHSTCNLKQVKKEHIQNIFSFYLFVKYHFQVHVGHNFYVWTFSVSTVQSLPREKNRKTSRWQLPVGKVDSKYRTEVKTALKNTERVPNVLGEQRYHFGDRAHNKEHSPKKMSSSSWAACAVMAAMPWTSAKRDVYGLRVTDKLKCRPRGALWNSPHNIPSHQHHHFLPEINEKCEWTFWHFEMLCMQTGLFLQQTVLLLSGQFLWKMVWWFVSSQIPLRFTRIPSARRVWKRILTAKDKL